MTPTTIQWNQGQNVMTVLPERGRIWQVSINHQEAFWINPSWAGDWNPGGDRLWVSPEIDWFWGTRKQPDFSQYTVPAPVDPGRWRVDRQARGFCRIHQVATIRHRHRSTTLRCELARSFTLVHPPDDCELDQALAYQTDNELRILDGQKGQPIGLWSLLQVPNGGEVVIPCRQRPASRLHFGSVPAALKERGKRELRFRITGDQQYKIGVRNESVTGHIAYARPVGNNYLVIYRRFFPQPWRCYCDRPMDAQQTPGDAVQVYNDGGAFGGFGEMEYHTPSLTVGQGPDRLLDTSLTIVGLLPRQRWRSWQERWLFQG